MESGKNRFEKSAYEKLSSILEQIEKGIKWDRIPEYEAHAVITGFLDKHPAVGKVAEYEDEYEDELDFLTTLMEKILEGVKLSIIPAKEATSVFKELNEKYPVEK